MKTEQIKRRKTARLTDGTRFKGSVDMALQSNFETITRCCRPTLQWHCAFDEATDCAGVCSTAHHVGVSVSNSIAGSAHAYSAGAGRMGE